MTANGFIIIPNFMFDALDRGIITRQMFDCLVLLCRWQEHGTGVVRAVSAERIADALSLHYENPPAVKTVRRWMQGLLYAKWFRRNYKNGRKLPYDVFLNFIGDSQDFGQERDAGRDNCDVEGRENVQVSPEDIIPWQQTTIFQGRDKNEDEERDAGRKKSPNNQRPSVPDGTVLCTADAAGAIDPLHGLISPSAPARGRSDAAGLLESKPTGERSTPAGKENLLTVLRKVAARELRNMRSVPKALKPTFGLMEAAHGFSAVVEDFTKWCGENRARHPKFPLFEYSKAIQDRLGDSPVSDALSTDSKPPKRADDPRVTALIRYVYEETRVAPDVKKVASLIATYGVEYTENAFWEGVNNIQPEYDSNASSKVYEKAYAKAQAEKGKFTKTLFSESGGLAIITAYRDTVLEDAAKLLIDSGGGNMSDAEKFCGNLSASQVISLYERYREIAKAKYLAATKKVKVSELAAAKS